MTQTNDILKVGIARLWWSSDLDELPPENAEHAHVLFGRHLIGYRCTESLPGAYGTFNGVRIGVGSMLCTESGYRLLAFDDLRRASYYWAAPVTLRSANEETPEDIHARASIQIGSAPDVCLYSGRFGMERIARHIQTSVYQEVRHDG